MKFDLSYLLGVMAFISLLLAPGAVESEKYILAIFLILTAGIAAHLTIKKDEKAPTTAKSEGAFKQQSNY